ncbi:MAG: hypothetical protein HOB17_01945 [Candidatus Marinimicrobia bacterium]|jgi:hypothetical protein|nr:hypothetical protein [Candidatus Neomarinimicrobiota bacterium]MBT3635182.1 hypothetical protein [Candidatus Neomarinimicrobiota bacterium]MBT3681801.1 hypothetical protein [Candidatus Neomarinimicrobiota bacterium]MBT3759528.1 hypothetical protein [Candidatus Neomarinimicrobiota bacterium]MBT4172641.1 hypothetical protein [Candidatus Neomarinimicrobiota bacterium]
MFDLTLRGQLLFLLPITVVLIFLLVNYFQLIKININILKTVTWIIRLLVIIITIVLLSDPYLQYKKVFEEDPAISVIIDNSQSMAYNRELSSDEFSHRIESLIDSLKLISDNVNLLSFGSELASIENLEDLSYDEVHTDFSQIPAYLNNISSKYNFLISDGIATSGRLPGDLSFNIYSQFYPIGVGSESSIHDLQISRVDHPFTIVHGDTLNSTIWLSHQIEKNVETKILITDSTGKQVYSSSIQISEGTGLVEIPVSIHDIDLKPPLKITISPVENEFQIENNSYDMDMTVLSESEEILMISGALSNNTGFIKSVLKTIPRAKINHHFRISSQLWNETIIPNDYQKSKIIILDNYPILNTDLNIYNQILNIARAANIPVVFLEGPNSNAITTSSITTTANITFEVPKNISPNLIKISDRGSLYFDKSDIDKLPPVSSLNHWSAKSENTILHFDDGFASIIRKTVPFRFLGIFVPDISTISMKLSHTENRNIFKDGLKSMILADLYSSEHLVNTRAGKSSYDLGEKVELTTQFNAEFIEKPSRISFIVKDENGVILEEIPGVFKVESQLFSGSFVPPENGYHNIETIASWNDNENNVLDSTRIMVQEAGVELRNLKLNRQELLKLAANSRGRYFDFNEISNIPTAINLIKEKKSESIRISTISTHNYWWILILLLTIEWILRKRIGLL